jgi:hypothetical protein
VTAALNASLLALLAINPPSFRPEFKMYNKFTATCGVILPLLLMIGTNHVYVQRSLKHTTFVAIATYI